jgi:hypothetical protein
MMESTARTVVAGYSMWVATYLEPWGVDECMSIWTLLKRFWVSFRCFVDFSITLFIFGHEGLC